MALAFELDEPPHPHKTSGVVINKARMSIGIE
jgi:hypothetical protein